MNNKKIAIAGSHGFIGTHLLERLEANNDIIRVNRKDLYDHHKLKHTIEKADVIVNLAGVPIYKIWTKKNKRMIYESRILPARNIVRALNEVKNKKMFYVNASAIGIYESDKCYDEENANYTDNFLSKVLIDWENEVKNLDKNHNFAIARFGIVLGEGGYLEKVLPAFKMKFKITMGTGKQYFSYVHINDAVRALEFVMDQELTGVVNITNNDNMEVKKLNSIMGRYYNTWVSIRIPTWLLKSVLGNQHVVFTEGQCVIPKKLDERKFEYRYTNIKEVLNSVK